MARLSLNRDQILTKRRRATGLGDRPPIAAGPLRRASRAGLQDSMPRAALLSIHARVADADPSSWEHPGLIQVWGPRYSTYVIAAEDRAVFTLGRHPEAPAAQKRAEEMARRLAESLDGEESTDRAVGEKLGVHSNALRYAATTGTVVIRWAGARAPTIRSVPRPTMELAAARQELARRYLEVFGPSDAQSFAGWAGVKARQAASTFAQLEAELSPVETPVGEGWILAGDEDAFRAEADESPTRLLPSGDAFYLLWGNHRELLVDEDAHRRELWTSRVWPGAVMLRGELVGTWRRAGARVSIEPWHALDPSQRDEIVAEGMSLPIPDLAGDIRVEWVT